MYIHCSFPFEKAYHNHLFAAEVTMSTLSGDEGRWEFEKNIGTGGFGIVKLFTNQVSARAPMST